MADVDHGAPVALNIEGMKERYSRTSNRMFFLDYDGTLTPIVPRPEDAAPTQELKDILKTLAADPKNRLYIISGRDRKTLEQWLGDLRVGMSAEHGCFVRPLPDLSDDCKGGRCQWKDLIKGQVDYSWKEKVVELFTNSMNRLSGAEIEIKEYAVTFHYRQCNKEDYKPILKNIKEQTLQMEKFYPTLNMVKGKKSWEARLKGITKGYIIQKILEMNKRDGVDFVFCAGDDVTDEDMFKELSTDPHLHGGVVTCIVNNKKSTATTYVEDQKEILECLRRLKDCTLFQAN